MKEYIKMPKAIKSCGWFRDNVTLSVFVRILFDADGDGVINTSLASIASDFGISVMQVRRSLNILAVTGWITSEGTSRGTKISVCNLDGYKRKLQAGQQAPQQAQQQADTPPYSPSPSFSPAPPISSTPSISPSIKKSAIADKESLAAAAERIYACYPASCPVSGRSTGKCSKDKDRIVKMLRENYTEEGLTAVIRWYIKDSIETESWIKNFSTFLNNVPDYPEIGGPSEGKGASFFDRPEWKEYITQLSKNRNV